jgi:hypothetical protein
MAESEPFDRIVAFVRGLGIAVAERPISRPTLVPGIDIVAGGLVVERSALCRPADLLHEAGHIALTPPGEREQLDGTITSSPAEELTTIAWTWAAAMHLGLEPEDVFHDEVISGNGPALRENFSTGHYVGIPMLQRWGLALAQSYPQMIRWTRT